MIRKLLGAAIAIATLFGSVAGVSAGDHIRVTDGNGNTHDLYCSFIDEHTSFQCTDMDRRTWNCTRRDERITCTRQ
jgi:hypothetical protein